MKVLSIPCVVSYVGSVLFGVRDPATISSTELLANSCCGLRSDCRSSNQESFKAFLDADGENSKDLLPHD